MKRKAYTQTQVDKALHSLTDWTVNKAGTQLSQTFQFENFVVALAFCAKIAVHAEVLNHHPDLELSYGKVKVKLSTHDAKGLTKMDFELARRIEKVK